MELSKRIRRPRWTDARLLIGAMLVVAAIVGTFLLVDAATSTTRVWVSAGSLVPGQVLEADDLVVAEVNLADVGERYVSAEAPIPEGSSVRTVIAPGELLPASVLVPVHELAGRVVAIDVAGSVPTGVDVGSLVDVWALPESNGLEDATAEPAQIVASAPVAHITRETGSFGVGDGARIEVFVPTAELSGLLSALDGTSILSVVGAPGAASGVRR
ncbi:flagellar basal body P-ring formation chaperone FlgA [Brevibacterium sanguinis]|uniref:Flagellar basal body P-ring formation chaperone FlgA n=2 Tax=Brevibacterium TaxID=1696 RepID=A0A366IMK3_9MICO|nr:MULTISPECIES: SAF domain-containing protein [Brevibacterium]RBP66154.1 flagellar basal body P-ring formation chaperone FlgA [Brevibacterium sanguinis]RBP72805.1 flagellar basal body P-ring formation chaperone FlgA [Brevibacterium celere]